MILPPILCHSAAEPILVNRILRSRWSHEHHFFNYMFVSFPGAAHWNQVIEDHASFKLRKLVVGKTLVWWRNLWKSFEILISDVFYRGCLNDVIIFWGERLSTLILDMGDPLKWHHKIDEQTAGQTDRQTERDRQRECERMDSVFKFFLMIFWWFFEPTMTNADFSKW